MTERRNKNQVSAEVPVKHKGREGSFFERNEGRVREDRRFGKVHALRYRSLTLSFSFFNLSAPTYRAGEGIISPIVAIKSPTRRDLCFDALCFI